MSPFAKPGSLSAFLQANARTVATWPAWKRSADALGRPRGADASTPVELVRYTRTEPTDSLAGDGADAREAGW